MLSYVKSIVLCSVLFVGAVTAHRSDAGTITVTGEGTVTAAPDVAYISVGVAEIRPTAREALDSMGAATQRVLLRLNSAGVAAADIQTGQLSLHPYYDSSSYGDEPAIAGFEASTMLNVRVRDLPNLGSVLDAVVHDGANRLGGIRFDVVDPNPLLDQARRAAVIQAREKAALFAEAAGVNLEDLQSLTEHGGQGHGPIALEMRSMDVASMVPVAEGEMALTASVTLVYTIIE